MAILSSSYVHQQKIAAIVEQVAKALSPDVLRIRYTLGEDWTGASAIFFRIVLSDPAASEESRLFANTQKISDRIVESVKPYELGLEAYFSFRSESEQQSTKEEGW